MYWRAGFFNSALYSIYDFTAQNPDMSIVKNYMDFLVLEPFIENLSPITFFSPPNFAWNYTIPQLEIEDVLKNHLFRGLWFDDVLMGMDGEYLQSTNGKLWLVTVVNDTVYIGNSPVSNPGLTNATFLPGPNSTNILARTGVIHQVDSVFLDYPYPSIDGSISFPNGPINVGPSVLTPTGGQPAPAPTSTPPSSGTIYFVGIGTTVLVTTMLGLLA